jgi:hypothetical protein
MITDDDLDVAMERGILSPNQATALRALAAEHRPVSRSGLLAHEERFRFMRGFNDFFFAIGIALLCAGMAFFAGTANSVPPFGTVFALTARTTQQIIAITVGNAIAAVIVWALAELLVRRLRLVLPGILLALFFVFFTYAVVPIEVLITLPARPVYTMFWNSEVWIAVFFKALVAAGAATLFYERFRLPFALMLVAGALVVVASTTLTSFYPSYSTIAVTSLLLICGLVVFAVAMKFDVSDRKRLTRRADCAFWLHLLAAPLIVHSLISLVTRDRFAGDTTTVLAIFGVVIVLAAVSIIIDRRALFVSALTYLGIVIGYAVTHATGQQTAFRSADANTVTFFATLLILGAVVVALGVGWMPLRRGLIATLPSALTHYFPAVPVRP